MNDTATIESILSKKKLTSKDLKVLRRFEPNDGQNRLYSFFTPIWLCEVMYNLAIRYGFNEEKGKVLEPSCGTGNFLEVLKNPQNCTAFELDPLNYKIAKKRVPKIGQLFNDYFETAFLKQPRFRSTLNKEASKSWLENSFDLVIGNPPYGKSINRHSIHFKNDKMKQKEMFFMYKSLQLLKKDGLLVFITSSSFMRNNKSYRPEKEKIGQIADFVDAYRMPKVFKNTEVPTDILIFRKK